MKITLKQILALTALLFLILFISCKKIDSTQEEIRSTPNEILDKFFNKNRTNDPREAALVTYLKNRNIKENFVENIVKKIGYPRWDKVLQFPNEVKTTTSSSLVDDSTSIYHIPFVRDSQNFVNASMILIANQSDTSISYKSDWQYAQKQNNIQNYNDSAENFALYFMVLDQTVFGYNKFNIIDSNLFRNNNKIVEYVTINSSNTTTNNLLAWIETCYDVNISVIDCPYPGNCRGTGGSCDKCIDCMSYISYEYCTEGWGDVGTGGGGTGGGGTGGGTGGGGPRPDGNPNPPICSNPPPPINKGNIQINNTIENCSSGWNPIPPILPTTLPATLLEIDYSSIIGPCLRAVIHDIGVSGHTTFILNTYFNQQLNVGGTQKKYSVKYLSNNSLTSPNGQPTPAVTQVVILPNGTKQVRITLNPTFFVNTTKEWVTAVILHELLHGIIVVEKPNHVTALAQHNWMFNNKAPLSIAQSLTELFPNIDQYDAIALGLHGLSEAYTIPNTNTIDPIKDVFSQNNYFQNLNQAITAGANYQNAVAGFGTPFC
jgi:hypothetical protein